MASRADLWVPPTSDAHRHQVDQAAHEHLQKGGVVRCMECGIAFSVKGQKVTNYPGR